MSASNPSGGTAAAENELLARLGLPPSASAEDVDQIHLAASQFLAAAPSSLKGWARAQAAALDEAYLTLTDPVGLEGSALRSPTRPPTVVPGGPATPPARRGSVSPPPAAVDAAIGDERDDDVPAADSTNGRTATAASLADETDTDDEDALYASVTPGAHRDLVSGGRSDRSTKTKAPKTNRTYGAQAIAAPAAAAPGANIWKRISLGGGLVIVAVAILLGANQILNGGAAAATGATSQPSPTAQAVDLAKVNTLMQQLSSNPSDIATLIALGDEYYFGNQYAVAGQWYDKALAVDPKNVKALNAKGAVQFSTNDLASAEATWKQVISLDAKNTEAHFNLAFLYFYKPTPDLVSAVREWNTVISLDPTSTFAQVAQQHLDSLAAKSMLPSASGSPAASGALPSGAAPSGGASPATSSGSPAGSAAPSGSPAAASPVSSTVNEGAKNLAFTSNSLTAPANTALTIHFDNQDSGTPHDMLIKDSSGNTVFSGDMVTGPSAVDYQVPALAAGTYTFTCTIHPTTMNGTLKVGS